MKLDWADSISSVLSEAVQFARLRCQTDFVAGPQVQVAARTNGDRFHACDGNFEEGVRAKML